MSKSKTVVAEATKETAKRGRPVIEGSARQAKLAAKAAREAAGEVISRGRPSNPESKRQARLAAQAARVAQGLEVKVGRPKGTAKPKDEKAEVAEVTEA